MTSADIPPGGGKEDFPIYIPWEKIKSNDEKMEKLRTH
jgi:hypothetical protein